MRLKPRASGLGGCQANAPRPRPAGTIRRLKRRVHWLGIGLIALMALASPIQSPPSAQSDLDALMQKVLARRDDNWKKLQQYVLEERDVIDVRGSSNRRIWSERREYIWYPRDGFFIRSPVKVNGVTVPDTDRRAAEDR